MIDAYGIFDMKHEQYEPSQREQDTEWLFDQHECNGEFSLTIHDIDEGFIPVLACQECCKTWHSLYTVVVHQNIRIAA